MIEGLSKLIVIYFIVIIILQWLINDFMDYLRQWEAEVESRKDLTKSERNKMILPKETIDGLKMTGMHKVHVHVSKLYMEVIKIILYIQF